MTILEAVKRGKTLENTYIVDAHMHICRVPKFFSRGSTLEEVIDAMDRVGVNIGIISNLWNTGEYWLGYEEVIHAVERYPGRFAGYISPNPNYDSFLKDFYYCLDSCCFKGIKLHPIQNMLPFDHPLYCEVYGAAAKKAMPVLLHTWGTDDMHKMEVLAARFPDTTFIIGHSGGEVDALVKAADAASKFDNLYLDTACSYTWYGTLGMMVKKAGARKVLFGSDAVWNCTAAAIGRVAYADITEEDKKLILGENARRIYNL